MNCEKIDCVDCKAKECENVAKLWASLEESMKHRIDAEFYILDSELREAFVKEISKNITFTRAWHTSPNYHSIVFGFPDSIVWPDCSKGVVDKLCKKFGLSEVKPGIFSDGFRESH